MNFPFKSFIQLCLLMLILSACTSDSDAGNSTELEQNITLVKAKPTILIAHKTNSSPVVSLIVRELIESQIRYPVVLEEYSIEDTLFIDLSQQKVDVFLEVWPSQISDFQRNILNNLNELGELGVEGQVGWHVSNDALEIFPKLDSWTGLKEPSIAEAFSTPSTSPNGRLISRPEYSSFDEELINFAGLPFEVEYFTNEISLRAELVSLKAAEKPYLIKEYSPSLISTEFELSPIESPSVDNCKPNVASCAYGKENILKYSSLGLNKKSTSVATFLKNFEISQKDYTILLSKEAEGQDPTVIAEQWILENEKKWSNWFEN